MKKQLNTTKNKPAYKTERATSSGGIIYRKERNKIKVVLISRNKGKVWCLPKGLVNKGEKVEDAALREAKEETGLKGKLIKKLGAIDYWFFFKKTRIHKVVHFYLIKHTGGNTKDHDFEVDEVKWFQIDDAIKIMSYKNEIEIMKKARKAIK